jgi:hypothetical protein
VQKAVADVGADPIAVFSAVGHAESRLSGFGSKEPSWLKRFIAAKNSALRYSSGFTPMAALAQVALVVLIFSDRRAIAQSIEA